LASTPLSHHFSLSEVERVTYKKNGYFLAVFRLTITACQTVALNQENGVKKLSRH
jgi:hypothetical protein